MLLVVALAACASGKAADRPAPSHEVVSGAGRLSGKGVHMDVSVGGAFATTVVKNAKVTASPSKPVLP
jgi:hypothetical protein